MKVKLTVNQKNLLTRYLTWCYKTTKEDLDRIDRYFTQLLVDDFMLSDLRKEKEYKSNVELKKLIDDFENHRQKKEDRVIPQKFLTITKSSLNPSYLYLQKRFDSIQKAIKHFLGVEALKRITVLYESEMTKRILEAREHT